MEDSLQYWEDFVDGYRQLERERQNAIDERKRKWRCPEIKKRLNYDLYEIYQTTHSKATCENIFAERMDRIIREQDDCHLYYLESCVEVCGYIVDFIVSKDVGDTEMPGIIVEMDGTQHYWNGIDRDIMRDFNILNDHQTYLKMYRIANSEFTGNWEYHCNRIIHWLNNWDFGPDSHGQTTYSIPEEFYEFSGLTKHRVLNWGSYYQFK